MKPFKWFEVVTVGGALGRTQLGSAEAWIDNSPDSCAVVLNFKDGEAFFRGKCDAPVSVGRAFLESFLTTWESNKRLTKEAEEVTEEVDIRKNNLRATVRPYFGREGFVWVRFEADNGDSFGGAMRATLGQGKRFAEAFLKGRERKILLKHKD